MQDNDGEADELGASTGVNRLLLVAVNGICTVSVSQAEKMGIGGLRYTVTFYPNSCLVHVNLAPLVVTLVHPDGDGHNPNFGESLDMIPDITAALEPLRAEVGPRRLLSGSRLGPGCSS